MIDYIKAIDSKAQYDTSAHKMSVMTEEHIGTYTDYS